MQLDLEFTGKYKKAGFDYSHTTKVDKDVVQLASDLTSADNPKLLEQAIKETIGKDLPEGFQTSEFVLEHGFLDFIVERKNLKDKVSKYLSMTFTAK